MLTPQILRYSKQERGYEMQTKYFKAVIIEENNIKLKVEN